MAIYCYFAGTKGVWVCRIRQSCTLVAVEGRLTLTHQNLPMIDPCWSCDPWFLCFSILNHGSHGLIGGEIRTGDQICSLECESAGCGIADGLKFYKGMVGNGNFPKAFFNFS